MQCMRLHVSNITKLGVLNIYFMLELEINEIIMKLHDALHNHNSLFLLIAVIEKIGNNC